MIRERRFALIKKILDVSDPMGLLSLGCPADEYSQEAHLIEDCLSKTDKQDRTTITDIIADIFFKQFGEPLSKAVCEEIANEIVDKLSI